MWYVELLPAKWKKLSPKMQATLNDCMNGSEDVPEIRQRMLIFPCWHDEKGSYDVMTFSDPVSGWQRTVRANGKVVKWRKVRNFWGDEDEAESSEPPKTWGFPTWAWAGTADAAGSEGGAAPLSLSSDVCHPEGYQ